jgi:transposase
MEDRPTIVTKKEETVSEITTIGLDLAKQVFHLVGFDSKGKEVKRKRLTRGKLAECVANLPPCLIAMEACGGAHHWARRFQDLGHEVRLIAPQYVKAYVRGNKNDYNDARAIGEAARVADMRFVQVKSVAQQDVQAMHRLREARVGERTALCNQLRGLLTEYGIVLAQGVGTVRQRVPELLEDAENGLSDFLRALLADAYRQLRELDGHIGFYTDALKAHARQNEAVERLQTLPGFGPIVASAFHAFVGNGHAFGKGRDLSAALGLVPRQHSSGGKTVLLGISKRGDRYLRSLLVHGARAVVRMADQKDDPLSRWICRLKVTRGANKAAVALANKLARIGWAILQRGGTYRAQPAPGGAG